MYHGHSTSIQLSSGAVLHRCGRGRWGEESVAAELVDYRSSVTVALCIHERAKKNDFLWAIIYLRTDTEGLSPNTYTTVIIAIR